MVASAEGLWSTFCPVYQNSVEEECHGLAPCGTCEGGVQGSSSHAKLCSPPCLLLLAAMAMSCAGLVLGCVLFLAVVFCLLCVWSAT
jgi:hypothetical protein